MVTLLADTDTDTDTDTDAATRAACDWEGLVRVVQARQVESSQVGVVVVLRIPCEPPVVGIWGRG